MDIIRGESRFCNVRQIQSYSNTVFIALAAEKNLVNLEPKVFSSRLAHYLSEINAIHPFREGNGRVQRLFISQHKLREELQVYAEQGKCVNRSYPFFASPKSVKTGFSANSLAQTFALLYEGAGLEGASSHSGRRTFLTNLANKGTAIHILKMLAGHRSISTTAAYLYSSPSQLKAAVELV